MAKKKEVPQPDPAPVETAVSTIETQPAPAVTAEPGEVDQLATAEPAMLPADVSEEPKPTFYIGRGDMSVIMNLRFLDDAGGTWQLDETKPGMFILRRIATGG